MNFDLSKSGEQRVLHLNEIDKWRMKAYENARIYKERIQKWHDEYIKNLKDFKVGDLVLLFNSCLRLFPGKLKSRWFDPYRVTKALPHGAIEITHPEKGILKVNGHRLKPYYGGEVGMAPRSKKAAGNHPREPTPEPKNMEFILPEHRT
ncbi:uncharacterized protein LOC120277724 [Dioscorea cayenensis subsp. rotundata]|uniref:Uncharacterized protein LOC120277724 n=1 Tax=Dioscorea cayennensis subsp. rotundata TaxID=55577 RepID=A0AB40CQV4_DIOCR|nr:uncharacterized protein LOC120277724 [Dioscorea cayenensis subsp. rotundata]